MDRQRIEVLMTSVVHSVSPEASLEEVVKLMRDETVSCVVVTEQDKPVGVLSERDLVRLLSELMDGASFERATVRDVMTINPVTVAANADLEEATYLTQARPFRRLPVVDDEGHLVGIVTQTDLLRGHAQIVERQRAAIQRAIAERTRELEAVVERVRALSLVDPLLQIGNRRAMEVDLKHTHETAMRYDRPYCVALFDVDCFKSYNDFYGHPAGDKVLQRVVAALRGSMRGSDRLYRYGGEELLLLLPETDQAGGGVLARRMVELVQLCAIPHERSDFGVVTLSGGVAGNKVEGEDCLTWQAIVERADACLYRAKSTGRNCVAPGAA